MKTKITANVLEDISKRLKGENFSQKGEKALVVITGTNIGLDKRIEWIKELKNNGMQISLVFSFMAEQLVDSKKIIGSLSPINIYKEEDVFKLKDIVKEHSMIIGPNITISTLAKVSSGMIDSFVPTLLWTFMYQGKKVFLDFASVKGYLGEETKNKEISDIIERHISVVKKMGAIEIKEDNYLENISPKFENNKTNLNKTNNENIYKKVITEKDISTLSPNQNIVLGNGTIITPLAKDKAREMNIKIEIKKGG